ncbi:MAG: hypothetical protein BWK76_10580 [Desulfobulbaceae bacterium A2]|nr:MAG: hypothetical protein BWK76_10580 [Desulfobulbaceae bacterium A2]
MKVLACAFFVLLVCCVVLADLGALPRVVRAVCNFPGGDKLGHFLLMGTLALLLNRALPGRKVGVWGRSFGWGTVAVAALVVPEEFSQLAMTQRTFSLMDLVADYLGILVLGEWRA